MDDERDSEVDARVARFQRVRELREFVCRGVVFHKGLLGWSPRRVETDIRIEGRYLVNEDQKFDLISVEVASLLGLFDTVQLLEARPRSEAEPNVCIVDTRRKKTVGKLRVNPASIEELIHRASTPRLKLVLLGDHEVGKTSLLRSLLGLQFEETCRPTVSDNYETVFSIDGRRIIVDLYDTSGQEDYDRLRPIAYPQVDAFLICFSALNPESKEHILSKWLPEIGVYEPDAPTLLCATKGDLADEKARGQALQVLPGHSILLTNAHCYELVVHAFTQCVAAGVLGPPKTRPARPAPVVAHISQDQLTKAAR